MAEYIEKNFALDVVRRTSGDYAPAFEEIAHATIADVIPVAHGEWRTYAGSLVACSVCGYEYLDYLECDNYCGNCGAKMDLKC